MTTTSTTMQIPVVKVTTTAKDVLLYKPNLIGYGRVLCTIISFLLMMYDVTVSTTNNNNSTQQWRWLIAILFYILSFVGDLFDGMIARMYNETSTFGSVLDMITDRCSTSGLLFVLACEYSTITTTSSITTPSLLLLSAEIMRISFVLLMVLDISSHWVQMYSTLSTAIVNGNTSVGHHKSEEDNANKNFLVRWFYKYYWFFGYLCCGTEFTYVLLYVQLKLQQHFYNDDITTNGSTFSIIQNLVQAGITIGFPGMIAKQIVNIAQLCSSCLVIAEQDAMLKNNKQQQSKMK